MEAKDVFLLISFPGNFCPLILACNKFCLFCGVRFAFLRKGPFVFAALAISAILPACLSALSADLTPNLGDKSVAT